MGNERSGGFWGDLTLTKIIWAILTLVVCWVVGALLMWVVAFALFAIWAVVECLCGKTKWGPKEVIDQKGEVAYDFTGVHRACPISVLKIMGTIIYSVCGAFVVGLVVVAASQMKWW